MRFAFLPLLAVLPCALAVNAGCSASSSDDPSIGAVESNQTSEGGAGESDGGSNEAAVANPPADVAPFTIADVTPAKLRFSYDGAPAVDALQTEWTTVISGEERRFQIQGATPVAGGRPVFYAEFGRGPALIEKGTYDCAQNEAVVLVIEKDATRMLTVVDGAPEPACKVIIDEAVDYVPTTGVRPRSWRKVVGRIEAVVRRETDGAAPAKNVRAAFAADVMER